MDRPRSVFQPPEDLDSQRRSVTIIEIGAANQASSVLNEAITRELDPTRMHVVNIRNNLDDWTGSLVPKVLSSAVLVLFFNEKRADVTRRILLLTMKRGMENRGLPTHLVDNVEDSPYDLLQHPRVRSLFQSVVKLRGENDLRSQLGHLASTVILGLMQPQVQNSNASTGEAFAWNFATTFLRFIVPNLETRITEALYDGDHLSESKLSSVGIQLPPERILVLKKYFVLAPDRLGQDVSPDVLFPGCVKTGILYFDGLGYQRKVFIYLMRLHQRTPSGETHAVIFADWASPIFLMRDMSVEASQGLDIAEVREEMFSQFKEALKMIIYHPSFSKLLFSNPELYTSTELSSRLKLVEVASEESLRNRIEEESQTLDASRVVMGNLSKLSIECEDPHVLVVMGSAIRDQTDTLKIALNSRLKGRYKLLAADERLFRECANIFRKILLVLSLDDLQGDESRYEVLAAAEKMNSSGECCVFVIIVGDLGVGIEAVHEVLPDRLRHLPYCCVAAVRNLTGDNVEGRLPFGQQLRTLGDVLDGLHLAEMECLKFEDHFPLISMGQVLIANVIYDFVSQLTEYIQNESNQGSALLFDKPYFMVLPANNRFPEQSALEQRLSDLGAQKKDESFLGSNGRPYNYQVWHWQDSRLAFMIPVQFSYLREQLNWGFSGLISPQQVDDILEEFGRGLEEDCRNYRFVKTVRWSGELEGAAGLLQLLRSSRLQ